MAEFSPKTWEAPVEFQEFPVSPTNVAQRVSECLGISIGPNDVLAEVLRYAAEDLEATRCIVEPYISTDWADEYQARYARMFQSYPRTPRRLHFFKSPKSQPIRIKDVAFAPTRANAGYLGYTVIRPFTPATVGDTFLRPPPATIGPLSQTQTTHILGTALQVNGFPFYEQDLLVTACPEADLWMVTRYHHFRGDCKRYRPSELGAMARKDAAIHDPRDGLHSEDIKLALVRAGLRTEMVTPASQSEARELLHIWLASGIPVIVGQQGHVVTAVGATLRNPKRGARIQTVSQLLHEVVFQDDQAGPYAHGEVRNIKIQGFEMARIDNSPITWLMAAIPDRVQLRVEDVQAVTNHWLSNRLSAFTEAFPPEIRPIMKQLWWTKDDLKGLVRRTTLVRSDAFKERLLEITSTNGATRDHDLIGSYWEMAMPKHVWLVELIQRQAFQANPETWKVVGELVIDSTHHPSDSEGALLAFHLRGRALLRTTKKLLATSFNPEPRTTESGSDWAFLHGLGTESYGIHAVA